jgi:hypothetical protein
VFARSSSKIFRASWPSAASAPSTRICARIVDDWFLHVRYPEADEEYDPSSYILLRIAREFL